jgi:hypothetical protein
LEFGELWRGIYFGYRWLPNLKNPILVSKWCQNGVILGSQMPGTPVAYHDNDLASSLFVIPMSKSGAKQNTKRRTTPHSMTLRANARVVT